MGLLLMFSGVFTSLATVYKKEGVAGLYKGNYFQMIRVLPYGALMYASYDIYKPVRNVWFKLSFTMTFKLCTHT